MMILEMIMKKILTLLSVASILVLFTGCCDCPYKRSSDAGFERSTPSEFLKPELESPAPPANPNAATGTQGKKKVTI